MQPDFVATRQQVRELDRIAIEEYGVSGVILMENAGRCCADAAERMLGGAEGARVAVVCGKGNNGGDGFVIARHLTNRGAEVAVLLLAEIADVFDREDETATNARIAQNMGIPTRELLTEGEVAEAVAAESATDLIVDAMLGTGVTGELREPYLTAVEAVNMAGAARLAVDVPSGLDCDTGRPLGAAVKADRTVTFVFQKAGFLEPGAAEYTGEVDVAEISVPRVAIERKVKEWQSEAT